MLSDVQRNDINDPVLRTEREAIMNAFDEHPDRPTCNVNDFMDEIPS